ncbi:hypothetical protein AB5J56_24975 [Streptomyces sp. R21]|uniref:Uncharacterized protein n=1 Tax=Streptomyces sp. R21 TaxID=3238627 RepID=A0AB39PAY3_9ACTN
MTSTPVIPVSAARFRINSAARANSSSPRGSSTEKVTLVSFRRLAAEDVDVADAEGDFVCAGAFEPVPAL